MLFIVAALRVEAKPLISHFRLKDITGANAPFRLYRNERIVLIITGMGRVAAGAGVAYLAAEFKPDKKSCWLNVGVAGHSTLGLGTSILAHKITSHANGKIWYPGFTFTTSLQTYDVVTVDEPSTAYLTNSVHDMEAAGFYSMAVRVATIDLIHCYKIISDNGRAPESDVTSALIERLLSEKLDEVEQLILQLQTLADAILPWARERDMITRLSSEHRYSVTQTHQLKRLVQRWLALSADKELSWPRIEAARGAKEVLQILENEIKQIATRFDSNELI